MKVFHIRLDAPGYSSDGIERAFRDNNIEYVGLPWQSIRFNLGKELLRAEIIKRAAEVKADLIFLHIQSEDVLDVQTAKELTKYGFVINYTFDIRSKQKTEWLYDIAPHIGLTAVACMEDVTELNKKGVNNCMLLPSSVDDELYKPQELPEEVIKSVPDIVFIGNNNVHSNLNFDKAQERADMVNFLKQEYGARFKAYGLGWGGSTFINPMEEINIYNACNIVITHNNFKRIGYCSDRQWRAIACGVLAVCQYYEGLEDDFSDSELFSWSDFGNLKEQIDYFLNNPAMRDFISLNQGKDFFDKHTWQHRIQKLLFRITNDQTPNV